MQDTIKNIVFDLGDVILNIDIPLTVHAFSRLSGRPESDLVQLFKETELFRKFETGSLSPAGFRNLIREQLKRPDWTDRQIDDAWNALLLDIPVERIALLRQLLSRYRLFLLSNTSSIHMLRVREIFGAAGGGVLEELFERIFLSYEIGIMKPDPEIYTHVLNTAGLNAAETLFLDDNLLNTEAARTLGIHTIHVQKPTTILEYLSHYVS